MSDNPILPATPSAPYSTSQDSAAASIWLNPWKRFLWGIVGVAAITTITILGAWYWSPQAVEQANEESSGKPPTGTKGVVDNLLCSQCHQKEYLAWTGSNHQRAMAHANARNVRGDFSNKSFTYHGTTSRFFKRQGKFFVNTLGPDDKNQDFEIKYTFGVQPLQQYLIEFPGGRLQSLTIAWDTVKRRWFHLYPKEKHALDDPLHWTGRYQNWNMMCAECHATNLRKYYDAKSDTYQTTWDAFHVGCQSCHGPGQDHLAWAKKAGKSKSAKEKGRKSNYGLRVNFKGNNAPYEVDACAMCHSRRQRLTDGEQFGRPLHDNYHPVLLREGLYHADGQQLDEVYVYGSFLQSKMHQKGVRCTDCHEPHSLRLKGKGNFTCTQCHGEAGNLRFPTLQKKKYDAPEHHFHKAGTPGAQCVNCHMPAKNYMVIHSRPDHSFRIPRPDLTVKIGTPNACNQCHQDKSAEWAAQAVAKWYGPARQKEGHYGETFAAARAGKLEAASGLVEIAGNMAQPAIVRATALELLRGYDSQAQEAFVKAKTDPDPLVRATAAGGLERLPFEERVVALAPLLRDSIRLVRIQAARALVAVPSNHFHRKDRQAFDKAFQELMEALQAQADMPTGQLNLAGVHAQRGNWRAAEMGYRNALRMDPYLVPARIALASYYSSREKNEDAERVLREGLLRTPREGQFHYHLGLLLAEEKRLQDAADELKKATELLPRHIRAHYNLGLALQHLNKRREAEKALNRAFDLNSNAPDVVNALANFYVQDKQWRRALPYAQKLVDLLPNNGQAKELLAGIKQRLEKR